MNNKNRIKCPQCGYEFAADEAFYRQAEEKIKAQLEEKAARQAQILNEQKKKLQEEKEELERLKSEQEKAVQERLEKEKKKLREQAENKAREEFEQQLKTLREENEKRKAENIKLKQKELELLQKENELKDKEEELRLDMEKEMLKKREEIAAEIRRKLEEKKEMEILEYKKKLEDQKKLVEEMRRRQEQGSMELQGEVQELALEEFLKMQYPHDKVEGVPKGMSGADVIHTVINSAGQQCGKIIYESKRTKAFSDSWIEKLKEDQRRAQADLAVIVTRAMPKDMERFGPKNRVWICSYQEVKGLSFALREILIQTQAVKSAEENKADKMEVLYNYLTGPEFSRRIEAIVEGFTGMKADLDKEKRAMQKIWKEREKQIEKVISNTADMYGAIKGIAGKAIGPVKSLELPGAEE